MSDDTPSPTTRTTRRRFLGGIGAAAGAAALGSGIASAQTRDGDRGGRDGRGDRGRGRGGGAGGGQSADEFSRLFRLPSFAEDAPGDLREALLALGAAGGPMDAQDPLEVGPTRLITEPELSPDNPDNPTHTAGTTFVGQFLDHDITADAGSRLGRVTPLRRSRNLRTAAFDLDSVYGAGPERRRRALPRRRPDPVPPRVRAASSRTCPATTRAAPSPPKAATTRTSSSAGSSAPSCPSTTPSSSGSAPAAGPATTTRSSPRPDAWSPGTTSG